MITEKTRYMSSITGQEYTTRAAADIAEFDFIRKQSEEFSEEHPTSFWYNHVCTESSINDEVRPHYIQIIKSIIAYLDLNSTSGLPYFFSMSHANKFSEAIRSGRDSLYRCVHIMHAFKLDPHDLSSCVDFMSRIRIVDPCLANLISEAWFTATMTFRGLVLVLKPGFGPHADDYIIINDIDEMLRYLKNDIESVVIDTNNLINYNKKEGTSDES